MSQEPREARKRRGPGRALLRLHRRVGVALSGVFIIVCITGILLNHSEDFDFQSRTIEADWVYDWYGMQPKGELLHFPLTQGSVSSLDGQLFFGIETLGHFSTPSCVVELEALNAIAFENSILLISPKGELIETLPEASIPGNSISSMSSLDQRTLLIDTDQGSYQSDENILDWKRIETATAGSVPSPSPAPEALRQELIKRYRGEGITWGRVLLDIHTGRFFGSVGKWLVDITAVALILLTLTGVYYTLRYLKKARERTPSR